MKARARIDLTDGARGGLVGPIPSPCQSLILRVEHNDTGEQPVNLGVSIATLAGHPLLPGSTHEAVELWFWDDVAAVFIVPGTRFTLRYPTRIVGTGQVLDVLPF